MLEYMRLIIFIRKERMVMDVGTKVKAFSGDYSSELEKKINEKLKGKRILHTSICTKESSGISRNSPKSSYFVALVTYEEKGY